MNQMLVKKRGSLIPDVPRKPCPHHPSYGGGLVKSTHSEPQDRPTSNDKDSRTTTPIKNIKLLSDRLEAGEQGNWSRFKKYKVLIELSRGSYLDNVDWVVDFRPQTPSKLEQRTVLEKICLTRENTLLFQLKHAQNSRWRVGISNSYYFRDPASTNPALLAEYRYPCSSPAGFPHALVGDCESQS